MADFNRHINCNHQSPKTDLPHGLWILSQGIPVMYQNLKINILFILESFINTIMFCFVQK